jgi:hypothetical protein
VLVPDAVSTKRCRLDRPAVNFGARTATSSFPSGVNDSEPLELPSLWLLPSIRRAAAEHDERPPQLDLLLSKLRLRGGVGMMIGEVTRSSEKAWRFTPDGKATWMPKLLTTLFVNELAGLVETSKRDLSDFAADAGGRS